MRAIYLIWAFMAFSFAAMAQDNIIFKDGTEVKAKVQEISETEVVYKRTDNLQGPVYRVARGSVFMIQFENGTSEVITPIDGPRNYAASKPQYGNYLRKPLVGTEYRSPGLAFLFSFLLPGGGQYYNKQYGKGAAMTTLWLGGIITAATSRDHYRYDYSNCYYDQFGNYVCDYYGSSGVNAQRTVGMVAVYGTWLWSFIDAPIVAAKRNRRNASGLTTSLQVNVGQQGKLRLYPFRSQGLGGALTLGF